MIEINLLPGSGKKSRKRVTGTNFASVVSDAAAKVRDPALMGAVATVAIVIAAVAWLWLGQRTQEKQLTGQLDAALRDSTSLSGMITDMKSVAARHDSVVRQISLLRVVDDQRYVWAHIMDELSRHLPEATWLTQVVPTSQQESPARLITDSTGAPVPRDTIVVPAPLKLRITGRVVDFQALTRFMTDLEASPFFSNVTLNATTQLVEGGTNVTEFHLDAQYETPPPDVVRRVPIRLSVR